MSLEKLRIEAQESTPLVDMDHELGYIHFSGICTPEDPHTFFKPITTWLENYFSAPKEKTLVKIHLEYFNTASSMVILHILKLLNAQESEIEVHWLVDEGDEDMMEVGDDYSAIVEDLNMKIIEVPE